MGEGPASQTYCMECHRLLLVLINSVKILISNWMKQRYFLSFYMLKIINNNRTQWRNFVLIINLESFYFIDKIGDSSAGSLIPVIPILYNSTSFTDHEFNSMSLRFKSEPHLACKIISLLAWSSMTIRKCLFYSSLYVNHIFIASQMIAYSSFFMARSTFSSCWVLRITGFRC